MSRKIPWFIVVFTILGMLGLVVIGRTLAAGSPSVPRPADSANAQREEKPPPGTKDERRDLSEKGAVGGLGVVEPVAPETRVAAAIGGRIAKIHVKEGETVTEGTVLVELDSAVEQAALTAAEAEIQLSKAELQRALRGQRSEDIEAAAAEATAAKARAEQSERARVRAESLFASGAVSKDELEKATSQSAADSASAKAADARRRLSASGSRSEDISAARARLAAAEARKAQTQATLDRSKVKAPINGEVLQIKLRVGEYYNPAGGEALLVLGDTSHLTVRMDLDERDIAKVTVGATAWAIADGFPGRKFSGKVIEKGRRMGRKNVRNDDPVERIDTKVLEIVILLDDAKDLVPGLRVTSYVAPPNTGG
ncbi:MAG: efflux RND transporter periplasmic adaptor subunit [Polyangiaceae bacterium]|nr:efflux RND transporter periplasmic adaptor subunit [Polyangiaceae bacterium]